MDSLAFADIMLNILFLIALILFIVMIWFITR